MKRVKFRPFWTYDVLKTQEWLKTQSEKGYHVVSFNPLFRLFTFERGKEENKQYVIVYEKGKDGYPDYLLKTQEYKGVYSTKNYSILEQRVEEPAYFPSYNGLLSKNQKIQFVAGILLLIQLLNSLLPIAILSFSFVSGNFAIEYEPGGIRPPANTQELIEGLLVLLILLFGIFVQVWLLYTYFKLKKSNKNIEELTKDHPELSFTVPVDTIMSKEDLKRLKREKKLVRKMRPGWFYSPDKYEEWLEEMESRGFHLVRMSKIGNSFYFIKGVPRKVNYHVDYQWKKNPSYFKINEESGWTLFFTSVTRHFAISVWGQVYEETRPEYYSDQENKVKHAKRFMLSYIVWMLPLALMYFLLFGLSIYGFNSLASLRGNVLLYVTPLMFFLVGVEFLYFSFRLMRYYGRVKSQQ
jgi:hypothetical protein